MRRTIRAAVMMAVLLMGVGAAGAQMIDPTTGVMVDPTTDPMDFSAVASGQPGNIGMELAAQANAAALQSAQDAMNSAQAAMNNATQQTTDNSAESVPSLPRLAKTAKPVFAPNGGKVLAGTAVTISDADARAVVYYTTDGKTPTAASARYGGPIMVSAKEKVRAMAFDVNLQPSGVVTKTFKIKG